MNLCNHHQTNHWLNKGLWVLILLMYSLFLFSFEGYTSENFASFGDTTTFEIQSGFISQGGPFLSQAVQLRNQTFRQMPIWWIWHSGTKNSLLPCGSAEKPIEHKISSRLHTFFSPHIKKGGETTPGYLFQRQKFKSELHQIFNSHISYMF